MTDDYTVSRWGPEPPPLPEWLAQTWRHATEGIASWPTAVPASDVPAAFRSIDATETLAAIDALLSRRPTHTLLVSEEHADRARRAVGDAWLALDVEVVPSPFVPEGQAYLIDRKAVEEAWRKPEPTTSWAEVARRVAERRGAAVIRETCCDLHGRNCEQGGEECCGDCTEVHHFKAGHGGVPCSSPDLSGNGEAHA